MILIQAVVVAIAIQGFTAAQRANPKRKAIEPVLDPDDFRNFIDIRSTTTEVPAPDYISQQEATDLIRRAESVVETAAAEEQRILAASGTFASSEVVETSSPFGRVASLLGSSPVVAQISRSAKVQLEALEQLKANNGLSKGEMDDLLSNNQIPQLLSASSETVVPDMGGTETMQLLASTSSTTCPFPLTTDPGSCPLNARYRTIDGTCNSLAFPLWGASNTPVKRYLPADYGDGIQEPRKAVSGDPLPSARAVSLAVHQGTSHPSSVLTLAMMTMAQFTDHDTTHTAISRFLDGTGELSDIECGFDGCQTTGPENADCFPIEIPPGDPTFFNENCLMFVRSAAVPAIDCTTGPRENINQVTACIDASEVYGSEPHLAEELRDNTTTARGKMKTEIHPNSPLTLPMLPFFNDHECIDTNTTVQCFRAGDERVNEQPSLTSMHTIFIREHNRIEEALYANHMNWSGEILYQETRRIVGAMLQVITYGEFLPLLLGPSMMDEFDLSLKKTGYIRVCTRMDPTIANVFGGAAFRVGHTLVSDFERFTDTSYTNSEDIPLEELFFRPHKHYETNTPAGMGLDSLIHGQISQMAESVDRFMTEALTQHLFAEPASAPGHDLASLNIQRARDQGIPGYTKWREWCGLSVPTGFFDMEGIDLATQTAFSNLYQSVEDVDLFPAGLSEKNLFLAHTGPTFACILANQFRDIKFGDTFWHERSDFYKRFEPDQLQEIRKASLARVICDNLDSVGHVQKRVLLKPKSEAGLAGCDEQQFFYGEDDNERLDCSEIPEMDLSLF